MKYLTLTVFLIFSMYVSNAQAKGDTTKPCTRCWPKIKDTAEPAFKDVVFLMQQNMKLFARIDKLEAEINSLMRMRWEDNNIDTVTYWLMDARIKSLEARPYLFIDLNKQQPGVWLTNKEGEYMWYIAPINLK